MEGNKMAKIEALELVNKIYDLLSKPCIVIEEVRQVCQKARAVLIATPLRNCDVGTVDEQQKRFRLFCESHKPDENKFAETGELLCPSTGCELKKCNFGECALKWAQLPYEEADGEIK